MNITSNTISEMLRPQTIGDLLQSEKIKRSLRAIIQHDLPLNLLFFGRTGIGKSSAAAIIAAGSHASQLNCADLDVSEYTSAIRSLHISHLCTRRSCLILEEADTMKKDLLNRLRVDIEGPYCTHARIIMTTNEIASIPPAIRSRFKEVCFDIEPDNYQQAISTLCIKYQVALASYNLPKKAIADAVNDNFPDMRRIANALHFEILSL